MTNDELDRLAKSVEADVIRWRREIHEHPELGNREFQTSRLVAAHLESLGIETKRGVAHTGVVGLLRGASEGPTVALRADMDALPVTEDVDVPFASKVTAEYEGKKVGVMHACGHDAHVAILMGVAKVLASMKSQIRGSVKFIFQPAEEGAPKGEEGGAELMVRQGVLEGVDRIFGLHVTSRHEVGQIAYRPGVLMAAVDKLRIVVEGKQTHGAYPWLGVDPIVVASQIVLGLQTIASRQLDASLAPAIITIGEIHAGVRNNIISDRAEMIGTLRSLDPAMRDEMHERIRRTAQKIAESAGARAVVEIERQYPMTINDGALTSHAVGVLRGVAGETNVVLIHPILGAEDFSFYQQKVPGVFFYLGTRPKDVTERDAASNHSPQFFVDESGLALGVKALAALALAR